MAHLGKRWPRKHEDLRLGPQHLCKKLMWYREPIVPQIKEGTLGKDA